MELTLKIDSIHPCTSSRKGVLWQGWTVKCHDERFRYLFCFWMPHSLMASSTVELDTEELTFAAWTDYVNQCGQRGMKLRSVEIHFTVDLSTDLQKWIYTYAYHKLIREQDLIDHFNPFSLN